MEIRPISFRIQKSGNEPNDYEDAFAFMNHGAFQQSNLALAVADGATESSFADAWAQMLTHAFARHPFADTKALQERTERLAKRWQSYVNGKRLAWYAEEKARVGAFSTFLGVRIMSGNDRACSGTWSAIAVGDTCLFHVRDNNLLSSFPISSSSEFGNTPPLLSSNLARNRGIWSYVKVSRGDWHRGDIFLLATDAFAHWFLSESESEHRPLERLLEITEPSARSQQSARFEAWVSSLRRSGQLRNDDVTVLLVRL